MANKYTFNSIEERFWSKVDVQGKDDCWNWQAHKHERGYGNFSFRGRLDRAHRVSWILANGDIPANMFVCHKCDNPSCVNPKHLFLGTCQDNVNDMMKKGRFKPCRGERQGSSKLTARDVINIRKSYETGRVREKELAKKYNVNSRTISKIVNYRAWAHLPTPTAGTKGE